MKCNAFVTNLYKKFTYSKVPLAMGIAMVLFSATQNTVYAGGIDGMFVAGVTRVMFEATSSESKVDASKTEDDKVEAAKDIVAKVTNTDSEESKQEDTAGEAKSDAEDDLDEKFGDSLVMADVENSVNIRSEADEDSDIVGKMYKDCAGKIVEEGDDWTKLETGDVTGWVNNDYLCFGEEAKTLAKQTGSLVATVNTETLRIRSEESVDSEVYGLLAQGEKIEAVEEDGEWVKVRYSDDTQGYVSAEYVSLEYEIDEGESIEVIEARIAAEEATKKAEEERKRKIEASRTKTTVTTKSTAVDSSISEQVLLAALIDCEAGTQPYEGKLAVGAVVVNRAKGRYGSVTKAINAPAQFGPVASGKVAAVAAAGPSPLAMKAASEALSGVSNVGTATHFRNTKSGYGGIVIGNHVFW